MTDRQCGNKFKTKSLSKNKRETEKEEINLCQENKRNQKPGQLEGGEKEIARTMNMVDSEKGGEGRR